jgi:hypothetical protein
MTYSITLTNGHALTTISDGTIDNTTSLTLIGKNYSGYGAFLDENFVYLLENFSNSTAPTNPLTGQLWWNNSTNVLQVFTGSVFKAISSSTASATQPSNASTGDLWFDTVNLQLYVYSGSAFILIGPSFTSATGQSGAIVSTVIDTSSVSHVIVYLFVSDVIVGIISKDAAFTPQSAISGFSTIQPGFNLASTSVIAGNQFTGEATNSAALNGLASTQFMRSDQNTSTTGSVAVQNNTGVLVGTAGDLSMYVSTSNVYLQNNDSNGNMYLQVSKSGTITPAITIAGATTNATFSGSILPATNNSLNIGSPSFVYNTIYATTFSGTATTAEYADLSERHEADAYYEPGTVISLGGTKEITITMDELSEDVFGVVSTQPALMMNHAAGSDETHPHISMIGRVPVKVIGKVKKGDRLVSAGNGYARVGLRSELTPFNVIGRSLEDKETSSEGVVEASVKLNS